MFVLKLAEQVEIAAFFCHGLRYTCFAAMSRNDIWLQRSLWMLRNGWLHAFGQAPFSSSVLRPLRGVETSARSLILKCCSETGLGQVLSTAGTLRTGLKATDTYASLVTAFTSGNATHSR
jgi:hypothetical protein